MIEKSVSAGDFEGEVARASGAPVTTAGLANQAAIMDVGDLRMSYVTHFFTEGLKGKADFTGDGVISLSELLVFVRAEVARVSKGSQTPMLGRGDGAGEMMFQLR